MKLNLFSFAVMVILAGVITPFHLSHSQAGVFPSTPLPEKNRTEFYHLLEAIETDSVAAQLAAVQNFLKQHADFALAYSKLLEKYLFHGRSKDAKAYFQQLANRPPHHRHSSWMLAKIFMLEKDPNAAFSAFLQALRAGPPSLPLLKDFIDFDHQQLGKFNGAARLGEIGLNRENQKIVSAFYCYKKLEYGQALKIFSSVSYDSSQEPTVLQLWGECFYRLVQYSQADSIWRIGLALARRNDDPEAEAQFLSNLGYLKYDFRDYPLALSYFDSANMIASRANDLSRRQWLAGYYAYIYRDLGKYNDAAKQFKAAIDIATKIGADRYSADWYKGYGITLYYLGNYNSALQALNQSEKYARRANKEELLVMIKLDQGNIYATLKQHVLAKKLFQEVYDLAQAKKMIFYQYYAKDKLGEIMLLEKKYAAAREYFKEFIDFLNKSNLRKQACEGMGRFAKTYLLEGRYDLARNAYLKAYAAAKEAGLKAFAGWNLLRIADLEVTAGNIAAAMPKYDRVREIAVQEKNNGMLWELYLGYGNAYQKSENLTAAIAAYCRAADIIEASRKELSAEQLRIGYFIEGQQVYRNLAHCYLQRYEQSGHRADLDSLFYYDGMCRSRALQDLRFSEKFPLENGAYGQTRRQLQALQRRLREEAETLRPEEEWNNLLSQLETIRYSLITQRVHMVKNDSFSQKKTRDQTIALPEILAELKRAELGLLLYHISAEAAFVLAAAGDQVKIARLQTSPSALAAAVDSLIAPFHTVKADSIQQTLFRAGIAHRLYKLLVQPAEVALPLPPRLVIVPDLALMNLPFDLLLTAPPNHSNYTPADFPDYADQFLARQYAFVYSPSPALLQERPGKAANNSGILAFANPFSGQKKAIAKQNQFRSRTGWRFDPLPFSEVEAMKIKEVCANTQVRRRENATKAVLLQEAPQYQVVHIASHAFVDTTFDAFSGLVLATGSDSTDDGMLMGYEITDLNLRCDLVALSACETGRGQQVAGEGVLGLPRLFLGAGARAVLMTLWKVDDRFASLLMPQFYQNFFSEGLSKTEALRRAKQALLSRKNPENGVYYQHPFYWASFMLFGDPGMRRQAAMSAADLILLFSAVLGLAGAVWLLRLRQRRAVLRKG
jgi:CHAT domain-containing protein